MRTALLKSYSIDDIDDVSKDIVALLLDNGVEHNRAVLALCRAIIMICDDRELDLICTLIDELSELQVDKITLD